MAEQMIHECSATTRKELRATREKPYHFVDSGLPNIYLVGIRYFECECGETFAEIPALKQLMSLIARNLVMKRESLSGDEIRFLRKQLGQKGLDFASRIKLEPETLSRIENGKQVLGGKTDSYIRIYYALSSKDPVLLESLKEAVDSLFGEKRKSARKPPKTVAKIEDDEWALEAAA
jgi:transcriptional regulator with XRE-family HTH domain